MRPGVADGLSLTDLQREALAASTWLPVHHRLLEVESLPLAARFFLNERDDPVATLRSYLFFAELRGRGVLLDGARGRDAGEEWQPPPAVLSILRQVREPPVIYPLSVRPRESGDPALNCRTEKPSWIPAFAGMNGECG